MNISTFRPSRCLLSIVLVASLAALIGCSGETSMDEQVACPSALTPEAERYTALPLGKGADGIQFHAVTSDSRAPVQVGSVGVLCKTASDKNACLAKVDTASKSKAAVGWKVGPSADAVGYETFNYGIATLGDDVFIVDSVDSVGKAIAPIDSAEKAVALVQLAGDANVQCSGPNVTRGQGTIVVKVLGYDCGVEYETLYSVKTDGRVVTGERRVLSSKDVSC